MKYNVLFSLRSSAKKDKPIRMRVAYGGTRFEYAVGYAVPPENWDEQKQRVKRATKNEAKQDSLEINQKIIQFENIVSQIFAEYEIQKKRVPTLAELKETFVRNVGSIHRGERNVQSYLQEFIEEQKVVKNWTTGTASGFVSLSKNLNEFDSDLCLEDINGDTMYRLLLYFQQKEYLGLTIHGKFKLIRWFLRWCLKKEYLKNESYKTFEFRLHLPDKEIIYLEREELLQLYEYDFDSITLSNTRDVFCFCCLTGLRYSDVRKLKKSDIHKGTISVITQKTRDSLTIDLNKYSQAILDKHSDIDYPKGLALPVPNNSQYNYCIREMSKIAGINSIQKITTLRGIQRIEKEYPKWQVLTSHSGRRTFVVSALRLGIPAEVIMKWTGHKNYQAMKPYIKIVDSLKKQEMTKFNEFL